VSEPIRQVSAGEFHVLALGVDQVVWAWGRNAEGQLGTGTTGGAPSASAVQVDARVAGITRLATGFFHSMAIGVNGAVWTWGANTHGELGDGAGVNEGTPVKLTLQAPATLIDGGQQTSMAVLADNTMWTWGSTIGILNDPSQYNLRPIQVAGVTGVTQIAMDDSTVLALMQATMVPNVVHMLISNAKAALLASNLAVGTVSGTPNPCNMPNQVLSQSVAAGTVVPVGTPVSLLYVVPSSCRPPPGPQPR
jgi:hypothetical protein